MLPLPPVDCRPTSHSVVTSSRQTTNARVLVFVHVGVWAPSEPENSLQSVRTKNAAELFSIFFFCILHRPPSSLLNRSNACACVRAWFHIDDGKTIYRSGNLWIKVAHISCLPRQKENLETLYYLMPQLGEKISKDGIWVVLSVVWTTNTTRLVGIRASPWHKTRPCVLVVRVQCAYRWLNQWTSTLVMKSNICSSNI